MNRRRIALCACLALGGGSVAAQVTPSTIQARVGFLIFSAPPSEPHPSAEALLQGLRAAGYIEGRNLVIERRYAEGRADRLPDLAADLVRRRVDVIMVFGPAPLQAARAATSSIPLVMLASSSDPVADGVAASLARPGGNITGLTYAVSSERFGKQLELLKLAAGRLTRVAVLSDLDLTTFRRSLAAPLAEAGRMLSLEVLAPTVVQDIRDLPAAFSSMRTLQADAMLVATGGPLSGARGRVAELALQNRLPSIAAFKEFAHNGLLMSYGPNLPDIYRRGAKYVDRILRGANAGDLPIELPTTYELVVNLRTAKILGLAVPRSLLLRADEVIQ